MDFSKKSGKAHDVPPITNLPTRAHCRANSPLYADDGAWKAEFAIQEKNRDNLAVPLATSYGSYTAIGTDTARWYFRDHKTKLGEDTLRFDRPIGVRDHVGHLQAMRDATVAQSRNIRMAAGQVPLGPKGSTDDEYAYFESSGPTHARGYAVNDVAPSGNKAAAVKRYRTRVMKEGTHYLTKHRPNRWEKHVVYGADQPNHFF